MDAGKGPTQIARHVDCALATAQGALARHGLLPLQISPQEKALLRRRYSHDGMTLHDLAAELGLTGHALKIRLLAAGIPLRTRGTRAGPSRIPPSAGQASS